MNRWNARADLVLLCAIVMAIADPLRVTPQIFNDLYGGATAQAGHHLIIGVADWIALIAFALIRPELWSIVAMLSGLILVIVAKIIGLPALPGWTMMMVPWLLVNWRHVRLARKEKIGLITIVPAVFGIWAGLIFTGHVVDPSMQGEHSIGWLYKTSDDPVEVGNPVQVYIKPGVYLTRRVASVEEDYATLSADNVNFGENVVESKPCLLSNLRLVTWTFSPRRAIRSLTEHGQFQNKADLAYGPFWSRKGDLLVAWSPKWLAVADRQVHPLLLQTHWVQATASKWQNGKLVFQASRDEYRAWNPANGKVESWSHLGYLKAEARKTPKVIGIDKVCFPVVASTLGGKPCSIEVMVKGRVRLKLTCMSDLPVDIELAGIRRSLAILKSSMQQFEFPSGGELKVIYEGSQDFPAIWLNVEIQQVPAQAGA